MFQSTTAFLTGVVLIAMTASPTFAHDDLRGPHGGAVADVDEHHVEFVATATELAFYLTMATDAPVASQGTTAKAIVQADGKTRHLVLTPAPPNKLVTVIDGALSTGSKVVVTGKFADGHRLQARFFVK